MTLEDTELTSPRHTQNLTTIYGMITSEKKPKTSEEMLCHWENEKKYQSMRERLKHSHAISHPLLCGPQSGGNSKPGDLPWEKGLYPHIRHPIFMTSTWDYKDVDYTWKESECTEEGLQQRENKSGLKIEKWNENYTRGNQKQIRGCRSMVQ